jgi:hypothetical protein
LLQAAACKRAMLVGLISIKFPIGYLAGVPGRWGSRA